MSDERIHPEPVLAPAPAVAKQPWHSPVLQEFDVLDTEAGETNVFFEDFQTYAS